jgi:putative membrane protein
MKFINSFIGALVALLVILFAVSNRQVVAVELWPFPYQLTMALYAVILLAVLAGFIAGVIALWLVNGAKRRELRRLRRHTRDLEQSLARHQMTTGNEGR